MNELLKADLLETIYSLRTESFSLFSYLFDYRVLLFSLTALNLEDCRLEEMPRRKFVVKHIGWV
jgi:hypothetical protein